MPLWVGIDDTDSPRGGCTTFVLTELLALAPAHGLDVIGEPRLVRLNPNIPWKTRGNAALSARFGRGRGRPRPGGEIGGQRVRIYPRGESPAAATRQAFLEDAWRTILASARSDEPGTDPAMVASSRSLPSRMYWRAVREVVPVQEVRRDLDAKGVWYRTCGSDRGLVGAAAAIAWPGRRATWEMIAYRHPSRWGRPREVEVASVREAEAAHPDLFLCYDPRTRRMLVAPHTPCPILFGLRGTTRSAPLRSRTMVRSEPAERWVLFRTNQGSGDHIVPRSPARWEDLLSGSVAGRVSGNPTDLPGGHVRFRMADRAGFPVECVAFEPTKTLPRIARLLRPGDEVRVWGSRGGEPGIRLEGIEVVRWALLEADGAPPKCPECGRGTRSMGRTRGFRCPACHRRLPPESSVRDPRVPPVPLGTYHPTASARRHLAPRAPET